MICPTCSSEMTCNNGTLHYLESGIDNVYLSGIEICKCTSCEEEIVSIPVVPELHNLIGLVLIKKKTLLSGKEIRFLRKNMGLTATRLAQHIGVDNATISRWENRSQPIGKSHDRLLRLVYSSIKGVPADEARHLIEKDFIDISPEQKDMPARTIPLNE